MVASTDPLIIYTQKNALLRICSTEYDPLDSDPSKHICNVAITKSTSWDHIINFELEEMEAYLLDEGIITNKNWL